jgi:hypothetical protein
MFSFKIIGTLKLNPLELKCMNRHLPLFAFAWLHNEVSEPVMQDLLKV